LASAEPFAIASQYRSKDELFVCDLNETMVLRTVELCGAKPVAIENVGQFEDLSDKPLFL